MLKSKSGFTLAEIIFVTGILTFVLVGMISFYIYASIQAELAGDKTMAINEAQNKIEEIRNHAFDLIPVDYVSGGTPGNVFSLTQLNGMGTIYIDTGNSELLGIEVVVCWEDKYDRIVGEDANLNGVLDGGEDQNSNGKVDSPVTLGSMITRR